MQLMPAALEVMEEACMPLVRISVKEGHTVEAKHAFYQRTAELLQEWANVRPEDVLFALTENDVAD